MQNLVSLGLMARYMEISKVFPIKTQVKLVTHGVGPNLSPGLYFGHFCGGLLDKVFPSISPNKTCNAWIGAKFDPRAIFWALLVEAY